MNLLASLSEVYHTSEDELKRTMEKIHSLIADVLKKKPYSASECKLESLYNIDTGKKFASAFFDLYSYLLYHLNIL